MVTLLALDYTKESRRYIELNPVTAGLVDAAERFRWSSASETEAA